MPILTFSRQMGSLGNEIIETLADRLGWETINRSDLVRRFLSEVATPSDLHLLRESAKHFLAPSLAGLTFIEHLEHGLHEYISNHPVLLVGFGSQVLFACHPEALHIRVVAPLEVRIARVRREYHVTDEEAARILATSDRRSRRFVQAVFDADLADASLYHLVLNTADLTVAEGVAVIQALLKERTFRRPAPVRENGQAEAIARDHAADRPAFKNPAEAEFARILDMYQIEWRYEPKTFPVEWDAEGNVTQAFSPDFYLTRFDTYLELTTMNQRYMSMKNRKLKRLRELYPGVNVRIVNRRDFHSLVDRFRQFAPQAISQPGPQAVSRENPQEGTE